MYLLARCGQRVVDVIWITRCQDVTSRCLIASEVASEMVDQIPMMLLWWWLLVKMSYCDSDVVPGLMRYSRWYWM